MKSPIKALGDGARGLLPWLLPIAILVIWELSALFGWLSTRILPEPFAVLKAGWTLALSGELWTHIRVSAGKALAGFATGGGLGLVLGLWTGSFRKMEIALDTSLQMIRNIPLLALIPLVILWFGIDVVVKLFLTYFRIFSPHASTLANRLRCRSQGVPYLLKCSPHSCGVIPRIGSINGNHQSTIKIDVQAVAVRSQNGDAVLRTAEVDKAVAKFAAFFQASEIRSVCCSQPG